MSNLKVIIFILILVFTTVLLSLTKPKMHNRVLIGDAGLQLVNQDVVSTSSNISIDNSKKIEPTQKVVKQEYKKAVSKPFTPVKNVISKKPSDSPKMVAPVLERVVEKPLPNKPKIRVLTPEEEEIIAWNEWRSNLQNRVMKDTKLRAPVGTVFRFSFTVDREGTISNLKTWSDTSEYTPLAVRTVKPTLLSYQGQQILNFPEKSKRIITNVNGKFIIWYSSSYSKPSDYSDYEKIR